MGNSSSISKWSGERDEYMTIVIVVDRIKPLTNGSVITARRFADGLRDRGHNVRIVAIGADGKDDCDLAQCNIPVINSILALNDFIFAKYDEEKVRKVFEGADIIHFIFPFALGHKAKKLADKMGIPTTCAFHVQPENISYNIHMGKFKWVNNLIYKFFHSYFYKSFHRIHCPSNFIAEQLRKHNYTNNLYVISNGYDPIFRLPEKKEDNEKFEIIMVGRLSPEKNQKVIVDAISASAHRENIHLTLYGNGANRKKLAKQAKKGGVSADFGFLPKEDLAVQLQKCDLYVHSAVVEIEAISCLEAIACGTVPVIADSDLSATPQFALDGRSLFQSDNAADLAKKIDYWYEHKKERREMEKKYAAFARTEYCLEKSLAKAEIMFADEISDFRHAGEAENGEIAEEEVF